MSVFRNLLMKVLGWLGKPADWSDIRKDCPVNSIALYAGVKSDYSQYDNLGFTATCTGGYNVFIDGVQYGSTYASGATCTITWSTSGITTGDDITTPSAMKAHKIWIQPATEGNNITAFQCKNSRWDSGLLWAHFNITNEITLTECFAVSYYSFGYNELLQAITAKNNKIKLSSANYFDGFVNTPVEYLPTFESDYNHSTAYSFGYVRVAPKLKFKSTNLTGTFYGSSFNKLKDYDYSAVTDMQDYITYNTSLQCDLLDVRSATGLKRIGVYGDISHVMSGFKGLRVSNEAPFNNATSPQINVSYTGMNRQALVTLFNDLPTVSDGQIINVTGCTGSENLTDEDISIAENKGWTVAGGPSYQVYSTYNASVGDTIKLNDGMATSDKNWSAYPSDTAITGDFTQTATVTAVEENNIIECAKPTIDNRTSTINTGKIYYAYTNENDNTDSVYAIDNPISESPNPSILYDSSFQELNPQPEFTIMQKGLQNATMYGSLTENNGIYSGFSSYNFLYINTSTPQTSMDFIIKCNPSTGFGDLLRTQPDGRGILLRCSSGSVLCYLSSTGSGWNVLGGFNTGITMTSNTDVYVRITWNSTNGVYTFWQSSDGETWTERNSSSGGLAAPYWSSGNQTIGGCTSYSEHWYGSVDMKETSLTIDGNKTTFYSTIDGIIINSDNYIKTSDNNLVQPITATIETVDNTTINSVSITSDQTATIETSANITTSNNDNVITDGSYHLFNLTVPTSMTSIIESSGISYQTNEMPLLLKKNSGLSILLKDGNNAYYRNSWIINRDYDLHFQQINFSYPSGATVTCKVNNVAQSNLTPYVYAGDIVFWTCDNAGTVTTGSYTVKYSSKDGNIQTITIS